MAKRKASPTQEGSTTTVQVTTEIFNLTDETPRIDRAIRILRMADNDGVASINFLADLARKEWRCNDTLVVADRIFVTLKGLRNQAPFKKFCRDFPAFCGWHGIYTDKTGTDKIAYLPEKSSPILIEKGGIGKAKTDYKEKREAALERSKSLIEKKIMFWNLAPIVAPEIDPQKIARSKYDKIISLFKDLRDSHDVWENSEHATEITQALDAISKVIPTLRADFLERLVADLMAADSE